MGSKTGSKIIYVVCVHCKQPFEVAFLDSSLRVHVCDKVSELLGRNYWLYQDGDGWVKEQPNEAHIVYFPRPVLTQGETSEDRQVPCEVIPLVKEHQRQDRPNSA